MTQGQLILFFCKNNEREIPLCMDVFRQPLILLQAHMLKGEIECVNASAVCSCNVFSRIIETYLTDHI